MTKKNEHNSQKIIKSSSKLPRVVIYCKCPHVNSNVMSNVPRLLKEAKQLNCKTSSSFSFESKSFLDLDIITKEKENDKYSNADKDIMSKLVEKYCVSKQPTMFYSQFCDFVPTKTLF